MEQKLWIAIQKMYPLTLDIHIVQYQKCITLLFIVQSLLDWFLTC